jgi:hypothetical protein
LSRLAGKKPENPKILLTENVKAFGVGLKIPCYCAGTAEGVEYFELFPALNQQPRCKP